jgi:glutamyl-tRNA reductase
LRDVVSADAIAPLAVAVLSARDVPAVDAALFAATSTALVAASPPAAGVHRFGLVTCERAMLVQWGDPAHVASALHTALAALGVPMALGQIRTYTGLDAVRHLLSLAAGLESSRVGEHEILGQLRTAWGNAWRQAPPHPMLDRVVQQVIGASRYVRATLPLTPQLGTLGEEAVAAVTAASAGAEWATRRALVVGTGSAATSALEALGRVGPAAVSVIGRTAARVRAVSTRYDARPFWWDDLPAVVNAHDVVIFAVRSAVPVIDGSTALRVGPAVWVDLGIPPCAIAQPGVTYVGLSALHEAVAADPGRAALGRAAVDVELGRVVRHVVRRQVA